MGYALPGGRGGRGSGMWWAAAATLAAFLATHTSVLSALRPRPVVAAVAHPAAQSRIRVVYRDAEGQWRTARAAASGRYVGMSEADWRRQMPGFRVRQAAQGWTFTEDGRGASRPYFLGIGSGRVSIWAGTPAGFRVMVDTTPILAGALGARDLDRFRRTVRVHSVAEGWRVLASTQA